MERSVTEDGYNPSTFHWPFIGWHVEDDIQSNMRTFRGHGISGVVEAINSYGTYYSVKGFVPVEALIAIIALLRIIREDFGGKYSGSTHDANLFILDCARRYISLVDPNHDSHVPVFGEQPQGSGCVDIWEE